MSKRKTETETSSPQEDEKQSGDQITHKTHCPICRGNVFIRSDESISEALLSHCSYQHTQKEIISTLARDLFLEKEELEETHY